MSGAAPRLPDDVTGNIITDGAAASSSAGGNKQSARLGSAAMHSTTYAALMRRRGGGWTTRTCRGRRPRGEAGSGRWLSGRKQLASGPALQLGRGAHPRSVPSRGTASPLVSALGWVGSWVCVLSGTRQLFPELLRRQARRQILRAQQ